MAEGGTAAVTGGGEFTAGDIVPSAGAGGETLGGGDKEAEGDGVE